MSGNMTQASAGVKALPRPKAHRRLTRPWRHKDVNGGEKSFAAGLNACKLIWTFIVGSVIGCIYEGIFVYLVYGYWQRRSGMMIGDFNQIYGLGAVLFVVLAHLMRNRSKTQIFLAVSLMGGTYEYVCGAIQKAVFGSVSWDYTGMPGSIGAHANVFIALGWGLMGVLFITWVQPFLSEMIERIPNRVTVGGKQVSFGKPLTVVLTVFLTANLGLTCLAQLRTYERHKGIPAQNAVSQWLDDAYPDEVIAEKFPNMDFIATAA